MTVGKTATLNEALGSPDLDRHGLFGVVDPDRNHTPGVTDTRTVAVRLMEHAG